ncbi:MAG: TonB-dependent receptor [Brevundimonas sp.]|uniref:TonB-dependent receptor domain-containing protein n=1 Tax=Brevundimonas sp. TaxID=1871086 RepID=UPI0027329D68|nr:TonB-dependent receptor [Brevundimonas sp.]MDP3403635.1 TonB-dependent receptor [Brevundimonas sp.]
MHRIFRLQTLLLTSTAAALFVLPAQAQEAGQDETQVDDIVVTGSRLGGSSILEAPQPVQVISAETIAAQGTTAISDLLDTLPALLSSTSSAQADGEAATLSLRGLGSNRTLVLVNGRRHVAGVPGSAAVDVSSIPSGLIERVDLLTGGASAVYGSDAVSGVVNFILKDDFEGQEFTMQAGLSGEGDANEVYGSLLLGRNFDNGRGNITLAVEGYDRQAIFYGDRSFTRDNFVADNYPNPELFFQAGDPIPPGQTRVLGRTILSGGNPRFAGTDPALIARARNARAQAFINRPTFDVSSTSGLIGFDTDGSGFSAPARFLSTFQDIDRDGINDCQESRAGREGYGCYVIDPVTGQVRPFVDGIYAGGINQSGGDGAGQTFNGTSLVPDEVQLSANLFVNYEVSEAFHPYAELKAVTTKSTTYNVYNTFDDSIPIQLDNPFIPAEILRIINAEIAADPSIAGVAKVLLGRDNIDLFDPAATNERETYRAVIGARGDLGWNLSYDVSLNFGRSQGETRSAVRLEDRYFSAIDAVRAPNGDIVCRSTLNPTALPRKGQLGPNPGGTIPFNTFTPGTGSACRPLNLFGLNRASQEALDFIAYTAIDQFTIEQTVFNAVLTGDSSPLFTLPGGPVGFVVGGEYREEKSDFDGDNFVNQGFNFESRVTADVRGEFDVKEAFAELRVPLLADMPFFHELTLTGAIRVGEYSTVGSTTTHKYDAVWAPIRDIRFRGGQATTVRAPNISELFSPITSFNARPIDPCDQNNIALGNNPANRLANCRADGIPVGFTDPLTSQFAGRTGGNPNLQEEESDSFTYGVVLQPRFIPGLAITVDYYNVEIKNAVQAVTTQDIVDSCYDGPDLTNVFCGQFTRNRNATSPTFLGFNSITTTQLNFAGLEASGIDFNVSYNFDFESLGRPSWGDVGLSVGGTHVEDRNNYPFATRPTQANPVELELNNPELALNAGIRWSIGDFTFNTAHQYMGEQALPGVEIENAANFTTPFADEIWIHDMSVRWQATDDYAVTFGVNNLTNEQPFVASVVTPVSSVGRYFFLRFATTY